MYNTLYKSFLNTEIHKNCAMILYAAAQLIQFMNAFSKKKKAFQQNFENQKNIYLEYSSETAHRLNCRKSRKRTRVELKSLSPIIFHTLAMA